MTLEEHLGEDVGAVSWQMNLALHAFHSRCLQDPDVPRIS